jgi:hypothetical protein
MSITLFLLESVTEKKRIADNNEYFSFIFNENVLCHGTKWDY